MARMDFPPISILTSMASRVVPAISETMTRCSPARVLMRVDFPAFRLPTMAIFMSTSGSGSPLYSGTRLKSLLSMSRRRYLEVAEQMSGVP